MGRYKDERDIVSLREWLASWGDGPHWADQSGLTVPVTKETFAELLDEIERLRGGLKEIRSNVLDSWSTDNPLMSRANLLAHIESVLGPLLEGK